MLCVVAMSTAYLLPMRAPSPVMITTADDAKATLTESLKYNKPLTEDGEKLVHTLVNSGAAPSTADKWWTGKFILISCNGLARTLRKMGGPLLDGSPVTMQICEDGSLEIETDMLVKGCATGLRFLGTAAIANDERLRLTLSATEFFEPSEEVGITKALNFCEETLRPTMPSDEQPASVAVAPIFSDETMLCTEAEETGTLVLLRNGQAYDVAKRRRG